jgi:hypothetical protein
MKTYYKWAYCHALSLDWYQTVKICDINMWTTQSELDKMSVWLSNLRYRYAVKHDKQ